MRIMCFSFVGMEVDVVNLPWGKKSVGQNFKVWMSHKREGEMACKKLE